MGKLVRLSTWASQQYKDGEITLRAIQYHAINGQIPGARKINGRWWVDPDKANRATGNKLADKILGIA